MISTRHKRSYQLPPIITHPLDDIWSIIVPIARTNLVTNPSFETNTTNWAALNTSTIPRSTTYQYHGVYSLSVIPAASGDGAVYGGTTAISTTSGTTYVYSMKFRGRAGKAYEMSIRTTGNVTVQAKQFTATGLWQWVWMFYTETSTTSRRLAITAAHSSPVTFYIDGVQFEACETGNYFPTTYIDGDQQGLVPNQVPAAYVWNGTAHASTSSRSGQTRAGGRVVPFKRYGWLLTAIVGLGLAIPQNQSTEYAVLDGGQDQNTRKPTRQFTLAGQFVARSYAQLRSNRSDLAAFFDRDYIAQDQRLKLRYQAMDGCIAVGEEAEVICKYQGGLEGSTDNSVADAAPITFVNYLPYVVSPGESGVSLTVQQSVANANGILQRSPSGLWQALGTGIGSADSVLAIARAPDGKLYVGGSFTSMGGVANTSRIAYWDGSAWNAMGTGCNGAVNAIAIGPDGTVYVGGGFSLAGGVANTVGIAKWNGSAWSAMGTGASGGSATVYALLVGPDGTVYAGGDFTLMGGVANTVYIAKWNGSAWSAMGTGMSATVFALANGIDGNIYAGGTFITAGGTSASRVAKWSGSVWSALGSNPTINGTVQTLVFDAAGNLYTGGFFTTIGGATFNYIGKFNGTAWTTLASGLNDVVNVIVLAPDGTLYVGGRFTGDGVITFPDSWARWNGSAWVFADTDFPGAARIFALHIANDGTLTVGYDQNGTATTAAITTATNNGTGKAYPALVIKGPSSGTSRIYIATNYTNGRTIYLNFTINTGETAYLRFQPDNLSFVSDFQGNIAPKIRPGSNESDFFLQPGANSISFFAAGNSVVAYLYWQNAYLSLDDL